MRVEHVIVCGHYGCGGIAAAHRRAPLGLIEKWLRHLQDLEERHQSDLAGLTDESAILDRLCELNVLDQARNVWRTSIVQDAMIRGQKLYIHGWVYRLTDGLLRDLKFRAPAHSAGSAADIPAGRS